MNLANRKQAHEFYADILRDAEREGAQPVKQAMAFLGRNDLFFLLVRLLNRPDIDKDWLFERCLEVQTQPNGFLDLWAREHYKSTIITFGLTIQDILNDPEVTIGLFSVTRPLAKGFAGQIKSELEGNKLLIELYPEVLWENPRRDAPTWSLDSGLTVKRKSNPKEGTLEAWGLVDAMPTGRHYKIRVYDDVIEERNVSNPEMIQKATKAWELSLNLGSTAPLAKYDDFNIERYVGTRYHLNDPYAEIMRRKAAIPRIYPGTDNGRPEGQPVLWTQEFMTEKRQKMGPYVFGCQILQDPIADEVQGFRTEWLKYYTPETLRGMNIYLLCDPASEKKKTSDYTVMLVIGMGQDKNYYLIDGIRDRLNLTERASKYIEFHRKYEPTSCSYEKFGMMADVEYIKERQDRENYRFNIVEFKTPTPKLDRIRSLIPLFESGRFYIPGVIHYIDYEGRQKNLVQQFVDEEYTMFPLAVHDDILDCMAQVRDPNFNAVFPITHFEREYHTQVFAETEYELFGG